MISSKQQQLLATFSEVVMSAMADVIREYDFKLSVAEIVMPDMWVKLTNRRDVQLTINFELLGVVSFIVRKRGCLREGKRHNLAPVIAARSGRQSPTYHSRFTEFSRDRIVEVLKAASVDMREFVPDILQGDFSAFL